jgi:hypothetical protein
MLVFFSSGVRKMVMSPKFYQQQIVDVGIEGLEIAPRSLADVRKAKKALTEERDNLIAPYDALDRLVEHYLAEIDNSKVYIDSFMEKGV